MKKYLFSCIPVNPIFFILLAISILYSDMLFAAITFDDTAYYYNERGKLLWRNVNAKKRVSYVIKTKKTYHQVFNDIPAEDSAAQLSDEYNTAEVQSISHATARKVQRLLKHGKTDHPLVVENVIAVQDKSIMLQMYNNIVTRCAVSDAHKSKEHGGAVFPDGTVTCISGELSDPRWLKGATLLLKEKAMVYYHSHPDAVVEQQLQSDRPEMYNPNRLQFIQTKQVQQISYVQGPSRQDQEAVGEGTGYVFGMRADGGLIYIYDKKGVKATLPISFVKKMRRLSNQKVKQVDSWYAAIVPALHLPYLF
jgi:hypothetical protein